MYVFIVDTDYLNTKPQMWNYLNADKKKLKKKTVAFILIYKAGKEQNEQEKMSFNNAVKN